MLFAALVLLGWLITLGLLRLGMSPLQRQQDRVYVNWVIAMICLFVTAAWSVAAMLDHQYPADDSVLWLGVVGLIALPFAILSGRTLQKMRVHTN